MMPVGGSGSVAKVLVIGDVATGKTSLIRRYAKNQFTEDYTATIGVDFSLKTVDDMVVQLWDIAGQERFQGLQRIFYSNALAAVIVYDMFNFRSFQSAARWKKDVDQKVFLPSGQRIPVLLLGNKCDKISESTQPEVTQQQIDAFVAEHKFEYHYQVSAKTGENVEEACNRLVSTIAQNNKAQIASPESVDPNTVRIDNSAPPSEEGGCC
jgi:small GTP-binding protein